jgi:hypothetical protein
MAIKNDIYGIGIMIMRLILKKSVIYTKEEILKHNPNEAK